MLVGFIDLKIKTFLRVINKQNKKNHLQGSVENKDKGVVFWVDKQDKKQVLPILTVK